MTKTMLAIDPGSSTGYAIAIITDDTASLIEYGIIEPLQCEYFGDTSIDMIKKIKDLIIKFNVDEIGIEDYFASSKFASGTNVNYFLRAAVQIACRELNKHYETLSISSWKSYIAGRSTPTKDQKVKYGKAESKKKFIQEALWKRFNIKFPNYSISLNTGKPIKFRNDVVDSVGQLFYLCNLRYNITKFTTTIANPPDVQLKQGSKKDFIYD